MSAIGKFWNDRILPYIPGIVRNDFWRKLFALVFSRHGNRFAPDHGGQFFRIGFRPFRIRIRLVG